MLNINFPPRDIVGVRVTRPGDFDVARGAAGRRVLTGSSDNTTRV